MRKREYAIWKLASISCICAGFWVVLFLELEPVMELGWAWWLPPLAHKLARRKGCKTQNKVQQKRRW